MVKTTRDRPPALRLPEIECLESLEKIEQAHALKSGETAFNVSHWDLSAEFQNELLPQLELPSLQSPLAYRFSEQVAEAVPVVEKLGGKAGVHHGIFTPSATTSILCILNWLKGRRKHKIIALCPAYFSLFHACRRFQISIQTAYLRREKGGYRLPPPESRIWQEPAVLWLTSPVYGAGAYLSDPDIDFVSGLLKQGWTVITDECLALPGRELIRKLGHHPSFVALYSPHKGLCMNGIKFSAVLFDRKHRTLMGRWADVWFSGLGCSSSVAITHFLSPNFDRYQACFFAAIARPRAIFDRLCAENRVDHDPQARGHFVSCYFPHLSTRLGQSKPFLEELVAATGGSIITGNRSKFSRSFGLCFRVNLARGGPRFEPKLARLLHYINAYTPGRPAAPASTL